MRHFRLFLFALVFLLHTSLVAAASVRSCCGDNDCPVIQCVSAGCLANAPAAALPATPAALPLAGSPVYAEEIVTALPMRDRKVWTPPD